MDFYVCDNVCGKKVKGGEIGRQLDQNVGGGGIRGLGKGIRR